MLYKWQPCLEAPVSPGTWSCLRGDMHSQVPLTHISRLPAPLVIGRVRLFCLPLLPNVLCSLVFPLQFPKLSQFLLRKLGALEFPDRDILGSLLFTFVVGWLHFCQRLVRKTHIGQSNCEAIKKRQRPARVLTNGFSSLTKHLS